MFIRKIRIHNYKSLRNVVFEPSGLSCLVGPNASGKSNFANALDFLSEVYNYGLEPAIARKGGFENIAFRKDRRSKAPLEFEISVEASLSELRYLSLLDTSLRKRKGDRITFLHRFSVSAANRNIKADFVVDNEQLEITHSATQKNEEPVISNLLSFSLGGDKKPELELTKDRNLKDLVQDIEYYTEFYEERFKGTEGMLERNRQELFFSFIPFRQTVFSDFVRFLSNVQVFQFSPYLSRTPGVPTPNPSLSSTGENLPAIIDWLQRNHEKRWEEVMSGMRDLMPELKNITVQYLHNKTLGIVFYERESGKGRGWNADEVSDGTIQTLAILVASVDPRISLLIIEELENSIHPWVIKTLIEKLRAMSQEKNVILTTHSPTLVDLLYPSEIWVTYRLEKETTVIRLTTLNQSIEKDWEDGKYKLSEFLDTGLIPQAVPGGVF